MFQKIQRYFYTLSPLKPVQIYSRFFYFIKRKFWQLGPFKDISRQAELLKTNLNLSDGNFQFSFLDRNIEYKKNLISWTDARNEKLWRYQLNYFDFLSDSSIESFSDQLFLFLDWIEKNPDDLSETWEPYPVSRRLCRWIFWIEKNEKQLQKFAAYFELIIESMIYQARRLRLDIEDHLQANHLFANLKALFRISGFFLRFSASQIFSTSEPENPTAEFRRSFNLLESQEKFFKKLRSYSENRLLIELTRQILPDGGHEERNPIYHKLMMEDIAEIIDEALLFPKSENLHLMAKTTHKKMFDWLLALSHPDGFPCLFGDSALNAFPGADKPISFSNKSFAENNSLFPKSGLNETMNYHFFPDSGFFTINWESGHYFAVNSGEAGPSHQPGHSHCDLLSFELSVHKERLIVDSGCGSYQTPEIRKFCRSTLAHNVPFIEGTEQSDAWGEFRMGKKARLLLREYSEEKIDGKVSFCCKIEDQNMNIFQRKIIFFNKRIKISDELLERKSNGQFISILHLYPGSSIIFSNDKKSVSIFSGIEKKISIVFNASSEIFDSVYYPKFGKGIRNSGLKFFSIEKLGEKEFIEFEIVFEDVPAKGL
ncbi:MAG: alginate lyase family protein [Candidatus Riflebacteria bacterium]|nr:alginate lyase family protein [Candidatus Riflebacteria bacterium]